MLIHVDKGVVVFGRKDTVPRGLKTIKLPSGRKVVRYDDVNYKVLRDVGPIKSPVETYYAFPRPVEWGSPMEHQVRGVNHIVYNKRCFLWSDIGTGKTAMATWSFDWMMRQQGVKRTLILAPKSTIHDVWQREIMRIAPSWNTRVLDGPVKRRVADLEKYSPDVVVCNHQSTLHMRDALVAWEPDLIIVDEQTAYGNITSKQTKGLKALIGRDTRLVMMSGEPMPDSPMNLHGPALMVCPDIVPDTKRGWELLTMMPSKSGHWVPIPDVEQSIVRMLKGRALYIKRDDCIDLPPTTFDVVRCEPSAQLKTAVKKLKNEAFASFDNEDKFVVAANEMAYRIKILQCACGSVKSVDKDGNEVPAKVDVTTKFEALQDTLVATHGPVLLFVPFRDCVDMLESWLVKNKVKYAVVHGGVSSTKRSDAFRKVENNEVKVLLAVPDAMAHGINNLVTANTIVWFGMPKSNQIFNQANGRIVRKGQTRKTYIRVLISTTLEREVYRRMRKKQSTQGALLSLVDNK